MEHIGKPSRSATKEEIDTLRNEQQTAYQQFLERVQEENYYPWDTARHVAREIGIPPEAAWEILSLQRSGFRATITPIHTPQNENFRFGIPTSFWSFAHRLDQGYAGRNNIAEELSEDRHRYLVEGIMEESIASSQLEGAKTTRAAAIELLKNERRPYTEDEQMIVNNFRAMQAIEERFVREPFTIAKILELHTMLVEKTKDDEGETPRLRENGETVVVMDKLTGQIYHEAPDAAFALAELQKLCDFANSPGNDTGRQFTHPFIKAVELHFWIGYLHPFTDGNGRLARLLFYWHLLRHGYWAAAFLPISSVIKNAKEGYPRAFLYSEQDNFDLTYFIDFNVRKMLEAMETFEKHREKTSVRLSERREFFSKYTLNQRQLTLMDYLMRHQTQSVSARSYSLLYRVSKPTALADLDKLIDAKLIQKEKHGRTVRYVLKEATTTATRK